MKKRFFTRILTFALLLTALLLLCCSCSNATVIDFSEMISVKYTGSTEAKEAYSGIGYARLTFNTNLLDKTAANTAQQEKFNEFVKSISLSENIVKNVTNGTSFTVIVNYDEELANELNIIINNNQFTYTPTELVELKTVPIDIWEKVTMTYSGTAPKGRVKLSYDYSLDDKQGELLGKDISLKFDENLQNNLKNGDKILVTAVYDVEALAVKGYTISEPVKEFVVDGMDSFITEVSQLDEKTVGYFSTIANEIEEENNESGTYWAKDENGYMTQYNFTSLDKSQLVNKSLYIKPTSYVYLPNGKQCVMIFVYNTTISLNANGSEKKENCQQITSLWIINPQIKADGTLTYDSTELNQYRTTQEFQEKTMSWLTDYTSIEF